jgi:crossover junction endodeoxyribonuclease RuvC
VRVFGIDPGSHRTGYGCIETDGSHHVIVFSGAIATSPTSFPIKLRTIHDRLAGLLEESRPDCVAIESLFHATNVQSALKLGHARGVAMLAAVEAGVEVFEYTPTEIKRAVAGYGRAEKHQVQQMVARLLGLSSVPVPHDAADALAVAICHVHSQLPDRIASSSAVDHQAPGSGIQVPRRKPEARPASAKAPTSWRAMRVHDPRKPVAAPTPDGGRVSKGAGTGIKSLH